jgi:hypothetical protein
VVIVGSARHHKCLPLLLIPRRRAHSAIVRGETRTRDHDAINAGLDTGDMLQSEPKSARENAIELGSVWQ